MNIEAFNAHRRGDIHKAERLYLVMLEGEFNPVVAGNLGTVLTQMGEFGRAAYWLRKSYEAEGSPEAMNNLGVCLKKLGRIDEAVEHYRAAKNHSSASLNNLGSALLELGEPEEAEKALASALTYDKKHADSHWNLGLSRLVQKKWAKGWEGYDWGFKSGERHPRPYVKFLKEYLGEDLKDKTIIVWGEQGIGDEMIFASCLPDLIKASEKVLVDCHPRLETVFRRSFPTAVIHGTRKSDKIEWTDKYSIDYHLPLGSLPRFFRERDEDFPREPYLKPDQKRVEFWKERFPKTRVGISWRGGSQKTSGTVRSFDLERFIPLLAPNDDVDFISLQYTDCYHEIAALKRIGVHLPHEEWALEDLNEQFNLIASCDLVISVITAVVHISGSMGIPTWCLVPKGVSGAWKFTKDEMNIWHPSVKHYHQAERYSWEPIIGQLTKDFGNWLKLSSLLSPSPDIKNTAKSSSKPPRKNGRRKK